VGIDDSRFCRLFRLHHPPSRASAPLSLDIYDYADARIYLRDWFEDKKAKNPRLSHRWFAKQLGTTDPTALAAVVSGRRSIGPVRANQFADALELTGDQREYFLLLVAFQHARNDKERLLALARIRAHRGQHRPALDADQLDFGSSYRYATVRELSRCAQFQSDATWIAAQLDPPITPEQAQDAVDTLLRIGLLETTPDGRWVPAEPAVETTLRVPTLGSYPYHQETDALARAALLRLEEIAEDSSFTGHTLSLPQARIPELRRLLWEAFHQVAQQVDAWEKPDRVVQVNVRMFPVSVSPEE
jgi:uncharacterized protein (TIGR02147 family)